MRPLCCPTGVSAVGSAVTDSWRRVWLGVCVRVLACSTPCQRRVSGSVQVVRSLLRFAMWDWRVVSVVLQALIASNPVIQSVPLHDQAAVERCVTDVMNDVLGNWNLPTIHTAQNARQRR